MLDVLPGLAGVVFLTSTALILPSEFSLPAYVLPFVVNVRSPPFSPDGLAFTSASLCLQARAFGRGGQGDRLFGRQVADARVLGFVGVLGQRRIVGGVVRFGGDDQLQDFHGRSRLVEAFFVVDAHHLLGQFQARLRGVLRDVARPRFGDLLKQRLALARQRAGAGHVGFARALLQLNFDQLFPRCEVMRLRCCEL